MRLLVISDIHGHVDMVRRLLTSEKNSDAIIIAGDITNFGGYEAAATVLGPILDKKIPVFAVAGNCDTDTVETYLNDQKIGLDGDCVKWGNYSFIGVGGSLPCPGNTPSEHSEDFFAAELNKVFQPTANPLIVVSHQPAWKTHLDLVAGHHRGSQAIRTFIENRKPILAISGHIHEAFGTDKIGPTTLVNPGPLKQGRYAIMDIDYHQVQACFKLIQ